MNIKRLTITGFKSYGETTTYEGFSNGLNAIIGFNGSGKSNFYKAIEFVLLDEYSKLTPTERRAILHEGVDRKAKKATIEIVFNNKARKIPINDDEVSIKRIVEEDKDELYINNKKKSRIDVHNLLESSGFNPSSGYYVVKQGKVNDLAIMQDKDRYDLICDIAGTKFYEQQREESMATIEKTHAQKSQIEDSLQFIHQRIEQLEKEKITLEKFEGLQNNRHAIEFLLQKQKSEKTLADIENKEAEIRELTERLQQYKITCDGYEKKINQKSSDLSEVTNNLESANNERSNREYEKVSCAKILSKEENNLYLIQKKAQQAQEASDKLKEMINNLEQQMTSKKEELSQISKNLLDVNTEISSIEAFLDVTDDFNIDRAKEEINNLQKSLSNYSYDNDSDTNTLNDINRSIDEKNAHINEVETKINSLLEELNSMNLEKEKILEKMKNFDELIKSKQDKIKAQKQILDTKIPFNILSGLSYIRANKINGIIGTVSDIIKMKNNEFAPLIELSLADHLFDIIVDTEQTADEIAEKIGTNGNLTIFSSENFLSDNKIVNNSLFDLVDCDDSFRNILMHYLGNIKFADDFDVEMIQQKQKIITKNNIFVDDNGVVLIPDESFVGTLDVIQSINEIHKTAEELKLNHFLIEQEYNDMNVKIHDINSNIDAQRSFRNDLLLELNSLENQKSETILKISNHEKQVMMINNINAGINQKINEIQAKIDVYSSKKKRLDDNTRNAKQKKLNNMKSQKTSLTEEKLKIVQEIDFSIPQLISNYERDLSNIKLSQINYKLNQCENDHKNALIAFENSDRKLNDISQKVSTLIEEKSTIESDLGLLNLDYESSKNNYDDINKRISIILDSVSSLKKNSINLQKTVSSQILEKYDGKNEKQLRAEMKSVIKELNNLGYVNQRARTQYEEFNSQMKKLNNDIENLNENEKSIFSIIEKLDEDKKNCLLKTFNIIKESFAVFYSKLTGGNQSDLLMDEDNKIVSIWLPSKVTIGQLSGGQKTVVALSLVFAIQHVNPAPFYLMDEVDAALDPQHRARLAELIKSQSNESQYIITTFKDELVQQSDTAFYLKFERGMTTPQVVPKEEALRIITTQ